ncbi:succinate-semialdehyde dehydrogenase, mitochondrial-like [Papaver somniferum]|uniref:succinate-semialdehyde dehydrogenase, mitochondrial-like n=1 Tax=Papaver somniferum TaxID=3469 RepID=UPI000E704E43|nr:succinate-semialdehyde dehydrogenase, mitochondrial-like [Papaver somniferum]
MGGKIHSLGMKFYEPTILGEVNNEMLIARTCCLCFQINVQRSWRVSEALEYGIVGVKEGIISTEVAPFGGVKQSGLGREGSKYGMDEYLEVKYVCMGNMGGNA